MFPLEAIKLFSFMKISTAGSIRFIPLILYKSGPTYTIVEYRAVAEQRLCRQQQFLGNTHYIDTRHNRRAMISVVRAATVDMQRRGKPVSKTTEVEFSS